MTYQCTGILLLDVETLRGIDAKSMLPMSFYFPPDSLCMWAQRMSMYEVHNMYFNVIQSSMVW